MSKPQVLWLRPNDSTMVCQGALGASWQLWIKSVSLASLWRSLETWTKPWPTTSSMMVAMPSFPPWRWEKEMSYRNLWVNNLPIWCSFLESSSASTPHHASSTWNLQLHIPGSERPWTPPILTATWKYTCVFIRGGAGGLHCGGSRWELVNLCDHPSPDLLKLKIL